ncbi:MAG: YcxB family protein [Planctomycetes bacterium]|nr:YcxB family protein [Planctomycetota bacterium]
MEPIQSIEYELTSEMATEIQRELVRWELRRGWRRDLPVLVGGVLFIALIVALGLGGWILPAVGGGLACLVVFFAMGAVWQRWWASQAAASMALIGLHTMERRVRVEFAEDRVRMETEFFRGEGAWTELDDVVVFATFWLLRLRNGGRIILPAKTITPELDAFIRAKAEQMTAPVLTA